MRNFTSTRKKTACFLAWISERCGNVCLFVAILWLVSFWVCIYIHYFFDVKRNKLEIMNIYQSYSKEDQKLKKRISENENNFPKTTGQLEFDCDLFTNLRRIIVVSDFSPSSFKLKIGILATLAK